MPEDICFVAFALFNVYWATLYLKFWKRASTEYCYRWGTLEKKDEMLKDPRPLFTVSINFASGFLFYLFCKHFNEIIFNKLFFCFEKIVNRNLER